RLDKYQHWPKLLESKMPPENEVAVSFFRSDLSYLGMLKCLEINNMESVLQGIPNDFRTTASAWKLLK
ncbi:MAG: hypothetical protein ACTHLX_16885, partial [Candidatus Binatia bacterium]